MTLIDDCILVDIRLEVPRQWRPAVLKRKADPSRPSWTKGKAGRFKLLLMAQYAYGYCQFGRGVNELPTLR